MIMAPPLELKISASSPTLGTDIPALGPEIPSLGTVDGARARFDNLSAGGTFSVGLTKGHWRPNEAIQLRGLENMEYLQAQTVRDQNPEHAVKFDSEKSHSQFF